MAHSSESAIELDGLLLIPDFLSEAQEATLLERIDAVEWAQSQSGRRKQVWSRSENMVTVENQDYGPQVNFKHKKVKTVKFIGKSAMGYCSLLEIL